MRPIAPDTWLVDVRFRGHPDYIGCYVLETGDGLALVDPGPASTLAMLEEGLRAGRREVDEITDLLLTHIHLDHAGAAGSLVRRNPRIRVHVHRRGAGHMIDPERLLASAERLYGDRMDELWGEFLPVPEANVAAIDGGERLALGQRRLEVAYTPGHAKHHVTYFDRDAGLAWVGDVAGVRIDGRGYVMPVTPPPDVDLESWRGSIAAIEERAPSLLCPTHFGPSAPVDEHLAEHAARLARWAERVAADLTARDVDDAAAIAHFRSDVRAEITAAVGAEDAARYLVGGGPSDNWRGLARYWRKLAPSRIRPPSRPW